MKDRCIGCININRGFNKDWFIIGRIGWGIHGWIDSYLFSSIRTYKQPVNDIRMQAPYLPDIFRFSEAAAFSQVTLDGLDRFVPAAPVSTGNGNGIGISKKFRNGRTGVPGYWRTRIL